MNKLLKYLLVGIVSLITITPCFSNADDLVLEGDFTYYQISLNSPYTMNTSNGYVYCFLTSTWDAELTVTYNGNNYTMYQNLLCFNGGYPITLNYTNFVESYNIYVWYFNSSENNFKYSSLQCQTEYNLIPISEVTPNYCALNFDMIDPSECPINEGTGSIVRSNLMINDVPYAQNQNINVFIPDFLQWNIAFNDLYTTIEVEGYNADTDYIEDVINKEKLTPTNEDFSNMLVGLANFFPYLAIAFIMFYIVKLIHKLFK